MVNKLKSPRRLIALAAFAIVAMSAFGFAATNDVEESNAGDGNDGVSGGTVTNIHYLLTAGRISGVEFDYAPVFGPEPTQAYIELLDGTTVVGSATCVAGTTTDLTCAISPTAAIGTIDSLRVVTAS